MNWFFLIFGLVALCFLSLGLRSLVRYARTRRVRFLVEGLVLSAGFGVAFFIFMAGMLGDELTTVIDGPLGGEPVYWRRLP